MKPYKARMLRNDIEETFVLFARSRDDAIKFLKDVYRDRVKILGASSRGLCDAVG